MAKSPDSLLVPAESPYRAPDQRRYDKLAKEQGWTKDQLRKGGDLPKKKLPNGIKLVKMPSDVLEDPFKNVPQLDGEQEYNALQKQFYERLSNSNVQQSPNKDTESKSAI